MGSAYTRGRGGFFGVFFKETKVGRRSITGRKSIELFAAGIRIAAAHKYKLVPIGRAKKKKREEGRLSSGSPRRESQGRRQIALGCDGTVRAGRAGKEERLPGRGADEGKTPFREET